MLNISTWRKPNDLGIALTRPRNIEFHSGLTVLIGCNGAGKTTLLRNIHKECEKANIPCHSYNNLKDGGGHAISNIFDGLSGFACDNTGMAIGLLSSSEGEAIKTNLGRQSTLYREFFQTGYYKDNDYKLGALFSSDDKPVTDNRRVLLLDAIDSGLSVDNIIEIKNLFSLMINDAQSIGKDLYIIVAANEYELCRGEQCFDVNLGKYRTFRGYESYRKFIVKSREKKEKRLEAIAIYKAKQKTKREQEEKGCTDLFRSPELTKYQRKFRLTRDD